MATYKVLHTFVDQQIPNHSYHHKVREVITKPENWKPPVSARLGPLVRRLDAPPKAAQTSRKVAK